MKKIFVILTALISLCAFAGAKLSLEPCALSGVPGELLRVELTVEAESAEEALLRVPSASNLVLRATEKYPVTQNRAGKFVQKKILLLQGVEAGKCVMTNLQVEINGTTHLFPPLTVEVRAVMPAAPPVAAKESPLPEV